MRRDKGASEGKGEGQDECEGEDERGARHGWVAVASE